MMDYLLLLPERIATRIFVHADSQCWEWVGSRTKDQYGTVRYEGAARLTHRVVREIIRGPIPPMHVLDHLLQDRPIAPGPCKVGPACCNPWHNEPVPVTINAKRVRGWNSRKTHCPAFHDYLTQGVTYSCKDGTTRRFCNTCDRLRKGRPEPTALVALSHELG